MNPPQEEAACKQEQAACNLCGGTDVEPFATATDYESAERTQHELVRCRRDGLIFVNPRPTEADIGSYYPQDYEPHGDEGSALPGKLTRLKGQKERSLKRVLGYDRERPRWLDRRRVARMQRRSKLMPYLLPYREGARLLDFGCGAGNLLGYYAERGWTAFGIEPDPEARQRATAKGATVASSLEALDIPEHSLDGAIFCHSVEHLHDPVGTLREIRKILRPTGTLILELPNVASAFRRWFADLWFPLEPPRHLYHFNQDTIRLAVEAAGFEVQSLVFSPSLGGLNKTLDRVLEGGEGPFLYRWLRKSKARRLLMRACAVFRASDIMTVVARPRAAP